MRKMGADRFCFSIVMPIYGTQLYEQVKRGGFLRDGFSDETLAAAETQIETRVYRKRCAWTMRTS